MRPRYLGLAQNGRINNHKCLVSFLKGGWKCRCIIHLYPKSLDPNINLIHKKGIYSRGCWYLLTFTFSSTQTANPPNLCRNLLSVPSGMEMHESKLDNPSDTKHQAQILKSEKVLPWSRMSLIMKTHVALISSRCHQHQDVELKVRSWLQNKALNRS